MQPPGSLRACLLVAVLGCLVAGQGTKTDIQGLLSGSTDSGTPTTSPQPSPSPLYAPPVPASPTTTPPAGLQPPVAPTAVASSPPAQPAQSPPAVLAQSPPAVPAQSPPAVAAQSPPAVPAQSPPAEPAQSPPAVPAQIPPAEPAQSPPVQPAQSPPAQPAQSPPVPISPPVSPFGSPPASPPPGSPPPASPVLPSASLPAPAAQPPAADAQSQAPQPGVLGPAAGPSEAASAPQAAVALSAVNLVVHLEGAGLWPFNASLQAQLLGTLRAVLPSVPGPNFTITGAQQSQQTLTGPGGRRLLQAASAADVSAQVSTATAGDATSAQSTLQTASDSGALQAAFNQQGAAQASVVTLGSAQPAQPLPPTGCSQGTLIDNLCLNNVSGGGGGTSLPTWAIVVIAVAGAAVLLSLLTLAFCCCLLRRKARKHSPALKQAARAYSPRKFFSQARATHPEGAEHVAAAPAAVPAAGASVAARPLPSPLPAPASGPAQAVKADRPSLTAEAAPKPAAAAPGRQVKPAAARAPAQGPEGGSPPLRTSPPSRSQGRRRSSSTSGGRYGSPPEHHHQASSGSLGRQRSSTYPASAGSDHSTTSAALSAERSPSLQSSTGTSRISASNQRASQYASSLPSKHANKALGALAKRHAARMARNLVPGPVTAAYMNQPFTLGGLYRLEPGRTVSDARVVAQGVAIGSGRKVTVELFVLASDFFNARRFANAVHSHDCLPDVVDTFDVEQADSRGESAAAAAIMHEGADYTLGDLLTEGQPRLSPEACKACVVQLLEALVLLHGQGVVHRALRPDNLLWYGLDGRWRLFGLARWARSGTDAPLIYHLRYTAPEVVKADLMATAVRDRALKGRAHQADADAPVNGVADPASDMWAAGAIAWQVFSGRPLYEGPVTDQDILGSLLGVGPLPFEEDPTLWVHFSQHQAAHLVQGLLTRRPEERLSAQAALAMAKDL